ncbi:hypothetical protein K8T06_13150, partial [bacterium]|nr:hypothetical protein [bacterium]
MAGEEALFLQALFNVWLQIAITVNEQIIQAGHSPIDMDLQDILRVTWRDKDFDTFKVVLDRDEFPGHAHPFLIKVLEELDFLPIDEGLYELELAESTIEELASGAIIRSQKTKIPETDISGKLTDAMHLKQAEMLLRKIIFAIRGLSMYPPGHPGLKKQFDSALESITGLMEGRRMVVLTQMAGSILINEIRIKSEERLVEPFIETLEERGLSSITFTPGVTSDELELLIKMFNYSLTALKDQGGPRAFLLNNGVDHIILDQYRYGVISADEEIVPVGSIGYSGGWGGGSGDGGS